MPGANDWLYEKCVQVAPEGMPIPFHECGTIPSSEELKESNTAWLYFMVWHSNYLTDPEYNTIEHLYEIYNDDYFITLDELPKFK